MAEHKEPGFTKLPVPGKDELRPNHRDAKPDRGPLAYVGEGRAGIGDMGAPAPDYPWQATKSPASPTFIAPDPVHGEKTEERPELPIVHMGKKRH